MISMMSGSIADVSSLTCSFIACKDMALAAVNYRRTQASHSHPTKIPTRPDWTEGARSMTYPPQFQTAVLHDLTRIAQRLDAIAHQFDAIAQRLDAHGQHPTPYPPTPPPPPTVTGRGLGAHEESMHPLHDHRTHLFFHTVRGCFGGNNHFEGLSRSWAVTQSV